MTAPEHCHWDPTVPAVWLVRLAIRKPGPLADSVHEVGACAKHLEAACRLGTVVGIRRAPEPPAL